MQQAMMADQVSAVERVGDDGVVREALAGQKSGLLIYYLSEPKASQSCPAVPSFRSETNYLGVQELQQRPASAVPDALRARLFRGWLPLVPVPIASDSGSCHRKPGDRVDEISQRALAA